jgi:plastocyanin
MKNTVAALLLGLLLLWSGVLSAEQTESPEPHRAKIDSDGVQHVSILGGDYFFRPSHVIVKVNVPIEFSVSLEKGIVPHTLVIQAPEAGIAVDESLSTEAKTIRFTPTAVGRYSYYCRNKLVFFKSHRERGMEGVLEVVE